MLYFLILYAFTSNHLLSTTAQDTPLLQITAEIPLASYSTFYECKPFILGPPKNVAKEMVDPYFWNDCCGYGPDTKFRSYEIKAVQCQKNETLSLPGLFLVEAVGILNYTSFMVSNFLPFTDTCGAIYTEEGSGTTKIDINVLRSDRCEDVTSVGLYKKRTIGMQSVSASLSSLNLMQVEDKFVLTMNDIKTDEEVEICVTSELITGNCFTSKGSEITSLEYDIRFFDIRSPLRVEMSMSGKTASKEVMIYFKSYCEKAECITCVQMMYYVSCEYPKTWWISVSILVMVSIVLCFNLLVCLLSGPISVFRTIFCFTKAQFSRAARTVRNKYSEMKDAQDTRKAKKNDSHRNDVENPESKSSVETSYSHASESLNTDQISARNILSKRAALGLLFLCVALPCDSLKTTGPADLVCPEISDPIWQRSVYEEGLTYLSNITSCKPSENGNICTAALNVGFSVTASAGTCKKWILNDIEETETTPIIIQICALGEVDSYSTQLEAIYGEPDVRSRVGGACPSSNPQADCTSTPTGPSCGSFTAFQGAHVSWGSGCFIDSDITMCSVSSFTLVDQWAGFSIRHMSTKPYFAMRVTYTSVDEDGLESPFDLVQCFSSEGMTDEDSLMKVVVGGSFTRIPYQLQNGKKVLWRLMSPSSLYVGNAANSYDSNTNGWGTWQTSCLSETCDCFGSKSYSIPSNPMILKNCRGPNGGWRCDGYLKDTNIGARQAIPITESVREYGRPVYKVTVDADVPILKLELDVNDPSTYFLQFTTKAISVKEQLTEACPEVGEMIVIKDRIGSAEATVVCAKVKSTCSSGIVYVTSSLALVNNPRCQALFDEQTECCFGIIVPELNSTVSFTFSGRTTVSKKVLVEGTLVQSVVGNQTDNPITLPPTYNIGSGFSLFGLEKIPSVLITLAIAVIAIICLALLICCVPRIGRSFRLKQKKI